MLQANKICEAQGFDEVQSWSIQVDGKLSCFRPRSRMQRNYDGESVLLVQKGQSFDYIAQTIFDIDVFSSVHRNEEELFLFQLEAGEDLASSYLVAEILDDFVDGIACDINLFGRECLRESSFRDFGRYRAAELNSRGQ